MEFLKEILGEPTKVFYGQYPNIINGACWHIPFSEHKKIAKILSRKKLIGYM